MRANSTALFFGQSLYSTNNIRRVRGGIHPKPNEYLIEERAIYFCWPLWEISRR